MNAITAIFLYNSPLAGWQGWPAYACTLQPWRWGWWRNTGSLSCWWNRRCKSCISLARLDSTVKLFLKEPLCLQSTMMAMMMMAKTMALKGVSTDFCYIKLCLLSRGALVSEEKCVKVFVAGTKSAKLTFTIPQGQLPVCAEDDKREKQNHFFECLQFFSTNSRDVLRVNSPDFAPSTATKAFIQFSHVYQ